MKRFILIALLVALFVGCSQPTLETPKAIDTPATTTPDTPATPTETPAPYFVKNSAWETVDISSLISARLARAAEPSLDQALAIVNDYNAVTNDDQLVVLTEDVPIEESPLVNVYIVNEGDYAILEEWIGLERADFAARRKDFVLGAAGLGGILFVDKVPPAPIILPDTRTREEKYALYMVNKYDEIVVYNGYKYEQHIDQIWDSLTDNIKEGYDNDIDKLMAARIAGFEAEIRGVGLVPPDTPWRVVYGQIYVKPEPPVEPPDPEPPASE